MREYAKPAIRLVAAFVLLCLLHDVASAMDFTISAKSVGQC